MITDILFNESTGDIDIEDVYGPDAFRQSLLLQLTTTLGSSLFQPEVGSRLHVLGKNSQDIEDRLEKIVSDSWEESILSGEVKSFDIVSVVFNYESKVLEFSINIDTPLGILNIYNV